MRHALTACPGNELTDPSAPGILGGAASPNRGTLSISACRVVELLPLQRPPGAKRRTQGGNPLRPLRLRHLQQIGDGRSPRPQPPLGDAPKPARSWADLRGSSEPRGEGVTLQRHL